MTKDITDEERDRIIAEDLARIDAIEDEDIDTDDIPEVLDWSDAVRGKFYRAAKEQDTVRDDADSDS